MALYRSKYRIVGGRPYRWIPLLCLVAGGCQPEVDQRELGHVVYRLPDVPGAETPYVLEHLESSEDKVAR